MYTQPYEAPVFQYNKQYFGGTEYMAKNFHSQVVRFLPKLSKYNCLIMPGESNRPYHELVSDSKDMIIWLHNLLDQFGPQLMYMFGDKRFVDKVKYFVVVSEYHKSILVDENGIDPDKVVVIHNAINPIENDTSRFNKVDTVKLIHMSAPERGLDIIINALPKITEDFRLNVYNNFYPDLLKFDPNMEELLNDDRIYFYGKTPRRTVYKDLSESHIFINPSIWKETFCLAQVEAMSANCLTVYNNYGSLPEVALGYGLSYTAKHEKPEDLEKHSDMFAKELTKGIKMIKENKFDWKDQSDAVNTKFSWESFKQSWINFHDEKL
jgi:UDP-glucose:(glucosyl)LPS alpha-1,2-glucosyltransferase